MTISGTGCCLYDYLYRDVSFESPDFRKFLSSLPGDGGLAPGGLVFAESLSRFAGLSAEECIAALTQGRKPDKVNLGGPAVVSMIHAAQVLPEEWNIQFYTCLGDDPESERLMEDLKRFPMTLYADRAPGWPVPSTVVLSDPSWHDGAGERSFVNTLGSALAFSPDMLDEGFFRSDICLWGGSALVPPLHDNLAFLTKKARERGCLNIAGTVYDFQHQAADPLHAWPLGTHENPAYPWIDILITDREEARRLSLQEDVEDAAEFLLAQGCGSCVITRGKDDVYVKTRSELFRSVPGKIFPVSELIVFDLAENPEKRGDTTGCGDNFMGGVLVSVARQMDADPAGPVDLEEAVVEGICAGGLALYHIGGVYAEKYPGEKKKKISEIKSRYKGQSA
ncbi:carbohydrate kinase family protein [Marispirochaeta aestuarii]|uniref:carbohydrate kinase family protein n=1 Tax=Marispirochaeta aestuarii TaxID=1963862 RepID=UPI0029C78065|nr:carbohydrate kinase family protein [Marispirochaeta aestuarii]